MNSAMTSSMVAPINISAKKRIAEVNSPCKSNAWYNTNRRFSLCSHCTPVGVNTRNGLKDVPLINGTTRRKLGNESTEDFATFLRGSFVEGRFVYRQNFFVRSYETGPDKTISMETLTNFLQESALNHVSSCGFSQNSFGTSYEMDLRKLIWVVTRIQVQVQRYSRWGDEIEVETWIDVGGKNGTRRDWIIRDGYTKEIIAKATRSNIILSYSLTYCVPKVFRFRYHN
ncbi:palmitoyl-acyl carrier protein thioesterase, chloroplastic-like [Vigna umbellata]|uniref:palmitoyl-acyl carrier protein thioesterase, chloroplastic-like n=1 Tax=Vigna umbellata TaxID=87088 RepID=UPI001F5EB7F8|nr:palmitoyl-acyl carrier protein thioesterase, chloroplastic-like [Vigna umbellata]